MTDYTLVILLTFFGFIALAAILLVPVYRFLKREERDSRSFPHRKSSSEPGASPSTNGKGDRSGV